MLIVKMMFEIYYVNGKGNGLENLVYDVYYNIGMVIYLVGFEVVCIVIIENGWLIILESMKNVYELIENFDGNGIMVLVIVIDKDYGGGGKIWVE